MGLSIRVIANPSPFSSISSPSLDSTLYFLHLETNKKDQTCHSHAPLGYLTGARPQFLKVGSHLVGQLSQWNEGRQLFSPLLSMSTIFIFHIYFKEIIIHFKSKEGLSAFLLRLPELG